MTEEYRHEDGIQSKFDPSDGILHVEMDEQVLQDSQSQQNLGTVLQKHTADRKIKGIVILPRKRSRMAH